MKLLKDSTNLTFRQIEARARRAGHHLPFTTASSALNRNRLPREDLSIAFLVALGCESSAQDEWLAALHRLSNEGSAGGPVAARQNLCDECAGKRDREQTVLVWTASFVASVGITVLAVAGVTRRLGMLVFRQPGRLRRMPDLRNGVGAG
ncbi:hypothetical protein [Herbidospora cretacea]|uniref:hypothetical protein n=1 Tax=Herbidospora cretacea TaxID=28444 RepID=UPI0012DFDCFE|nr:hypothetical protein [Herbidospora cretacea]